MPPNVQSAEPLTTLPPPKSKSDKVTLLELPSKFVRPNTRVWVPDSGDVSSVIVISWHGGVGADKDWNRQNRQTRSVLLHHELLLPRAWTGKDAGVVGERHVARVGELQLDGNALPRCESRC